jgi:hypothetical protein
LDLYERLALFGTALTPDQRVEVLLAAQYNDLRMFFDEPDHRHMEACSLVLDRCDEWDDLLRTLELDGDVTANDWQDQILEADRRLRGTPGMKPLPRSAALNRMLSRSGLCPLLRYAFDQWYELAYASAGLDDRMLCDLVNLSTAFLYRLVPVDQPTIAGTWIGSGSYSDVYRSTDGTEALKVPRNLAAFAFASQDEHEASQYAHTSALGPYIPAHLDFDPDTRIIRREFLMHTSGLELLTDDGFQRAPFGVPLLTALYEAACDIYASCGINFDIHPGNVVWSHEREQWFLIDLGPMPSIGADYFPRHGFAAYFTKVWLDLHELMRTIPIRSVDILLPATPMVDR